MSESPRRGPSPSGGDGRPWFTTLYPWKGNGMATLRSTIQKRARIVQEVRKDHGDCFTVRKGWRYVLVVCKVCRKMFQVPYNQPGHDYARRQLRQHESYGCRR